MILKQPADQQLQKAENLEENKASSENGEEEPMEVSSDDDVQEGPNGLWSYLDQAEDCIYEFTDQKRKLDHRFSSNMKAIGYVEVCFT